MLIPPFSFSPNSQVEEDTCSCPHGFQHSSSGFFFALSPFCSSLAFPNTPRHSFPMITYPPLLQGLAWG